MDELSTVPGTKEHGSITKLLSSPLRILTRKLSTLDSTLKEEQIRPQQMKCQPRTTGTTEGTPSHHNMTPSPSDVDGGKLCSLLLSEAVTTTLKVLRTTGATSLKVSKLIWTDFCFIDVFSRLRALAQILRLKLLLSNNMIYLHLT